MKKFVAVMVLVSMCSIAFAGVFDPPVKTEAEVTYEDMKTSAPKILMGAKNRCRTEFERLWGKITEDNPTPKTVEQVQDVLDLFGSDSYQLFVMHAKWQEWIATMDADYEPLAPYYALTFNEDGTVTVSESE